MTIEVVRADVTPVTIITIFTVADRLHALFIKITSLGIRMTTCARFWAMTFSARHLVVTKLRVSIEADLALVAETSKSVVPAVDTFSLNSGKKIIVLNHL